ncbi:MAG TPA: hypothetical protein VF707_16050, partial [Ardenticatenaceae bacterium]
MGDKKPQDLEQYKAWLKDKHEIDKLWRERNRYEHISEKIKVDFERSEFWQSLVAACPSFDQTYLANTGYRLFVGPVGPHHVPLVFVKPFDSFLLKTFRKNVLLNRNWPNPPADGWILPNNWFSRINDIVRTLIVVKYLDGVDFILNF